MPSFIGAGIAEGATRVGEYIQGRDLREEQLATAKLQREQAEQQLTERKATQPMREAKAELAAYQANAQLLRTQTYDALQRYDVDEDTRHLNLFLDQAKQNPMGQKVYSRYARFDNLGSVKRTPEVDTILKQAGYQDPEDAYRENNPNMIIATRPDGKYELLDLDTFKRATGFNKYATNQQLEQQTKKARINQMLRGGASFAKVQQVDALAEKIMQENPDLGTAGAYKQAKSILDQSGGSADERMINQIMEEEGISAMQAAERYYAAKRQGTGVTNERQFVEQYMAENPDASYTEAASAYANRGMTTTQKELSSVAEAKDKLKKSGFFEKNLRDMSQAERADVHETIAEIEDLRNIKLSTEDKRLARQFRDLTSLGNQAGEKLTDEETGLLDTMLNKINVYLTNEVGGKEATSAYESFRNIYRNALYGASLTKSEIESFNKAMGTLGQQTKPVLAQLKTQLNSIKSQLESVRDTNDPYLAHYYFGSGIEDIDEAIQGIEQRLDLVTTNTSGQEIRVRRKPTSERVRETIQTAEPQEPGSPKPPLDEIFGGSNEG